MLAWIVCIIGMEFYLGSIAHWLYGQYHGNFLSPNALYKNTNMNKSSCIIISILLILLFHLYSICIFVHWLTHLGRNDET